MTANLPIIGTHRYEYRWVQAVNDNTPDTRLLCEHGGDGWRVVSGAALGTFILMEREIR